MPYQKNKMLRLTEKAARLPSGLRNFVLSRLFGRLVPFIGTSGVSFESIGQERLVVSIRNQRKVQNHIKGVHAAAMALLAETATGFIMGLNVPDDKLLLLKSMKIDYLQRAQGALCATASLQPDQIEILQREDKGAFSVPVSVTDESGQAPIACEMVWAWIPKKDTRKM